MSLESIVGGAATKAVNFLQNNFIKYTPSRDAAKGNLVKAALGGAAAIALNVWGGTIGDIASVAPWAYTASRAYRALRDYGN